MNQKLFQNLKLESSEIPFILRGSFTVTLEQMRKTGEALLRNNFYKKCVLTLIDPFLANVPFLYPLKTSVKPFAFLMFSGGRTKEYCTEMNTYKYILTNKIHMNLGYPHCYIGHFVNQLDLVFLSFLEPFCLKYVCKCCRNLTLKYGAHFAVPRA